MPTTDFLATGADARGVLDFWLEDAVTLGWPSRSLGELWFGGGSALDQEIGQRFGPLVHSAQSGGLSAWESSAMDRLALVIVIDQFSRNLFRGHGQAFAGDLRAQALVSDALAQGWDQRLPLAGRLFLYMPLMHAESLALQDECVRRFQSLLAAAPPERRTDLQGNLEFARKHRDIIARFGRFPYRNAALDRANSDAEQVFLRDGPRFGQ